MARRRKKKSNGLSEIIGPMIAIIIILAIMKQYDWLIIASLFTVAIVALAVGIRVYQTNKLRASGILEIDKMDGHRFEEYLVQLFKQHGYDAMKTKGSGDYGVDLVLKKNGTKIVVQAKRYKSKVNLKAVQEVIGGKGYYNAQEAWVVTNSFYADSAIRLAKSNGVKLIHRKDLMKLMEAAKSKK